MFGSPSTGPSYTTRWRDRSAAQSLQLVPKQRAPHPSHRGVPTHRALVHDDGEMVLVTLFHLRDCAVLLWDRAGKDRAGLHCDRGGEQCEVDVLVEVVADQRGRHAKMQLEVEAPYLRPRGWHAEMLLEFEAPRCRPRGSTLPESSST